MANPRVVVRYDRIAKAFHPTGTLYEKMRSIGVVNYDAAVHYAPKRTGRMAKSIIFEIHPLQVFHAEYVIGPTVNYAIFSLNGTRGPITAKGGKLLWVRPRPYSYFIWRPEFASIAQGRTPMFWVNGQKQNDWLGKSLAFTLRRFGLK
jgi:hypothetical protein